MRQSGNNSRVKKTARDFGPKDVTVVSSRMTDAFIHLDCKETVENFRHSHSSAAAAVSETAFR